jgi:chromosome segregation ATPase
VVNVNNSLYTLRVAKNKTAPPVREKTGSQIIDAEARAAEAEARVAEMQEELSRAMPAADRAQQEARVLAVEVERLRTTALRDDRRASSQVETLTQRLAGSEETLQARSRECEMLTEELTAARAELDALSERLDAQRAGHAAELDRATSMKSRLETTEHELHLRLESATRDAAEARREAGAVRAEVDASRAEADAQRVRAEEVAESLARAQDAHAAAIEDLQRQVRELSDERDSLVASLETTTTSLRQNAVQHSLYVDKIDTVEARLAKTTAELEEAAAKSEAAQKQTQVLEQRCADLRQAAAVASAARVDLLDELAEAKSRLETALISRTALSAALESVNGTASAADGEARALGRALGEREGTIATLTERVKVSWLGMNLILSYFPLCATHIPNHFFFFFLSTHDRLPKLPWKRPTCARRSRSGDVSCFARSGTSSRRTRAASGSGSGKFRAAGHVGRQPRCSRRAMRH